MARILGSIIFFEMYNQYPSNWPQIARYYKEQVGWKCEECGIDLRAGKEFLEVHHINGLKRDNEEKNLRALCIRCHAEMPQHLKSSPRYLEYLKWFDRH